MAKKYLFILSILSFFIFESISAGIVYVDPVLGNDNYDGRSATFTGALVGPNRTIQGGVDDALSGDTVLLLKGIYIVIDNIDPKDSILIRGEMRDSVIVQAESNSNPNVLNQDYVFNFITPSGSFIRDLRIENLSIYNADEASIMALRTIGFQARDINIYGAGVNSTKAPDADGIRILESRDFVVENIIMKDLSKSGFVFGGGVFNGVIRNVDFENIGSGLFTGAIVMWTDAGSDVPSADINNVNFEGDFSFKNCSNGFVLEVTENRTINIDANNVTSAFSGIENADILRYDIGNAPDLYQFGKDFGLNYVGILGLVAGLEAIYKNLDSMLVEAQNPLYVNSAICKNLDETSYYLNGNMKPDLALADLSSGDTLLFFSGNFANKSIEIVKDMTLASFGNNTDLKDLIIDGTDIEVPLINNFTISNELRLDNGKFITDDQNSIFLKASARPLGGSNNSFVSGPLHLESNSDALEGLVFPVGKADKYRPIEIWVDQENTNPTYYKAEMINREATVNTLDPELGAISPSHFWEIEQFSPNTFDDLFVFVEYQFNDFIFQPAELRLAGADASRDWINLEGNADGARTGRIRSISLSSFLDIALASSEDGTANFDPNGGGDITSIDISEHKIEVKVFPNPSNDIVNIQLGEIQEQDLRLSLFDINGKLLQSERIVTKTHQLNLAAYSAGIYFLQVSDEFGKTLYKEKLARQ